MKQPLLLLQYDETIPEWKLDQSVRDRGRAGVAIARAALDAARPTFLDSEAA